MCEDFAPNFGDNSTGSCVTTAHRLTLPLAPKTRRPSPPPAFPFSVTAKGRHFDTVEVIEADSQVMLSTTSRMQLKTGRAEGDYFEGHGNQ
jgi:hypothetical protein